jgi:hypothetical protein
VSSAATNLFGYALPNRAQSERGFADLGSDAQKCDEVAFLGRGINSHEKIRTGKREKVNRVRVDDAAGVEQLAQQASRGRDLDAKNSIDRFGRDEVMGVRTGATNATGYSRHFLDVHSLHEAFKTAELHDV